MINKTLSRRRGFPSCFRPAVDSTTTTTTTTNLTTSLYHTRLGIIALTWSHFFLGRRSVVVHHPHHSHHISFGPFLFWRKHGSVQFPLPSGSATLSWDLTRAKFGSRSGPEPGSGFYIALLIDSQPILLVGDLNPKPVSGYPNPHSLVVRREHVQGSKLHATKAVIGGRNRAISIECNESEPDPRLVIRVDGVKVLQVKHLKWKFRGGERIDVDGYPVLISWDVYNWLFDDCEKGEGYALFTFRFEIETSGSGGRRRWRRKSVVDGGAAGGERMEEEERTGGENEKCVVIGVDVSIVGVVGVWVGVGLGERRGDRAQGPHWLLFACLCLEVMIFIFFIIVW